MPAAPRASIRNGIGTSGAIRGPTGDRRPIGSVEFGGSAWSWDQTTRQFYYHAFLAEQPDLNWRNPEVQEAMLNVMRFWLARGVDGFRVDAIHMLIESEQLIDNPPNPAWLPAHSPARRLLRLHSSDQPQTQAMVGAMRRVADEFGDCVLIGEANLPYDRLMRYYGESPAGLPSALQLPFAEHAMAGARHRRARQAVRGGRCLAVPGLTGSWVIMTARA